MTNLGRRAYYHKWRDRYRISIYLSEALSERGKANHLREILATLPIKPLLHKGRKP